MITYRVLKNREYLRNEVTIEELREVLLRNYYPKMDDFQFKDEVQRPLIITEVKADYGKNSSIIFSVKGSPPKGEGILFINFESEECWRGDLLIIERHLKNFKKVRDITILKEEKKDDTPNIKE